MLRALLLVIVFATGSVFFAQWLKDKGAGYVMIYFDHYSVETSLGFLVLLIIALLFVVYVIVKLVSFVIRAILGSGVFAKRLHRKKLLGKQAEGMLAYHSEHWQQAAKQLYQTASVTDRPFISYLFSAKAYLKFKDAEGAKQALKKAMQCQHIDRVSLLLTQVDLAILMQDATKAEKTLKQALTVYPKDPKVLLKAASFYQEVHLDDDLDHLIAPIEKQQLLPASSIEKLKLEQIKHEFEQAIKDNDAKKIEKIYRRSKPFQQVTACYMAYFNALKSQHDMPSLLSKVEKQLKHEASGELLAFYTRIGHDKPRQYALLKHLQEVQGQTADTSLALGCVARALNDKDKAIEHLKAAIAMNPSSPAVKEMSEVYSGA